MKTRTLIILWTLPFWLIVGTILYMFIDVNGLNIPWKLVGKPSENLSKIIGFNLVGRKLYVYSDSGEMYFVQSDPYESSSQPQANWTKDQDYKKEYDPVYIYGFEPKKSLTPPPPFKVKQIYQFEDRGVEGSTLIAFALSEDGNLWQWEHGSGGLQGFINFLILGIEIMAYAWSFILFMVISLIRRAIRNQAIKRV